METLKKVRLGKILASTLVIFMLSWITLFSSCTASLQTPRHVRTDVVIQGQIGSDHQRDYRQERLDRREKRRHHDQD
jgi:hypothetical protein